MQHHAQDAVDAEPGMSEALGGVVLFVLHLVSAPCTLTFSCAFHVRRSVSSGWLTFRARV